VAARAAFAIFLLQQQGIDHLILEKNRIAHAWRAERWDSFCLVTPNRQCVLPGFSYAGEYGGKDPHGFMLRDEIVAFLETYARREPARARRCRRNARGPA
jgi:putative flavoprotein involved in K+ transport